MTRHPTSDWIVQQLREAFPYEPAKFLILDHDTKYGFEVPTAIRSMDIKPVQATIGCPWQITRGTYIHALPAEAKEAFQKVEDLLTGPKRTQIWKSTEMATSLTGTDQVGNGS